MGSFEGTIVTASEVLIGDRIVNVGAVVGRVLVGVFVVLAVECEVWSLAIGTRRKQRVDVVRHCAELVTVCERNDE